jgi:hypothetical protein
MTAEIETAAPRKDVVELVHFFLEGGINIRRTFKLLLRKLPRGTEEK